MSGPEKALLDLALKGSLWLPQRGPQLAAYLSAADELFYGGSAGGGKSDLLLGLAFTAHRRSIIYRREFPQLRGLIDRGNEILRPIGGRALYNTQAKVWRLPDGRILELGGVQYDDDWEKHQGIPHDLKAFDEGTQFNRAIVETLSIWNRTDDPEQRTRVVMTGNPPLTVEGEWVIDDFAPWLDEAHANPARPGELRYFVRLDGVDTEVPDSTPVLHKGEYLRPRSRTFIPARVSDNAFLARTGYAESLQGLPDELRERFLGGKFKRAAGDQEYQVIPTAWVRAAMDRWREYEQRHGSTPPSALSQVGVDVAAGGDDETVFSARYGQWFAPLKVYKGVQTPDGRATAQKFMQANLSAGNVPVLVDIIGIGMDAYGRIKDIHTNTQAFNASEAATGKDSTGKLEFRNRRAEAWWGMREALHPETGDGLMLPPDDMLRRELCAPTWKLTPGGVLVESKDDIKKRLRRSTNYADAVIQARYAAQQKQFRVVTI